MIMQTRNWMLEIAIVLVALAAGIPASTLAASSPANPTSEAEIKIDNFSFSPASLTVPLGTTVRWTNRDDIPHTVVSENKTFKSKALDTDQEFTYTFTRPGTYNYFCSIHPKMTAKIVVQ